MPEELNYDHSENGSMGESIDELIRLEKTDKNAFIRRITEFYIKNKVFAACVDAPECGYKSTGYINTEIAEAFIELDNKCLDDYEWYLTKLYRKGVHR